MNCARSRRYAATVFWDRFRSPPRWRRKSSTAPPDLRTPAVTATNTPRDERGFLVSLSAGASRGSRSPGSGPPVSAQLALDGASELEASQRPRVREWVLAQETGKAVRIRRAGLQGVQDHRFVQPETRHACLGQPLRQRFENVGGVRTQRRAVSEQLMRPGRKLR